MDTKEALAIGNSTSAEAPLTPTGSGEPHPHSDYHLPGDADSTTGKGMGDSGYASAASESSLRKTPPRSIANTIAEGASNPRRASPPFTKSDSATSVSRHSVVSHMSLPFTGTLPLGSLRLHQAADSPLSPPKDSRMADAALDRHPRPPPPAAQRSCLDNGDVFLILDAPQKFMVGHDAMALTAEVQGVLGIRDIPLGPHLLWVSDPASMSRCGYWYVSGEKGEMRVKQWDRYNETLVEPASQFEARMQRDSLETTYPSLVPYDYRVSSDNEHDKITTLPSRTATASSSLKAVSVKGAEMPTPSDTTGDRGSLWRQLTSAITPEFLARVTGQGKDAKEWLVDSSYTAKGQLQFPQTSTLFKPLHATELDFLLPQDAVDLNFAQVRDLGLDYSTDTTNRVLSLLKASVSETDIIAELQFVYLTGMHLGNYACAEQWWHLVLKIFLRAHQLVVARPALCRRFIETIKAQMEYGDRFLGADGAGNDKNSTGGILDMMPQNKGKLREALTVYKRRLNEALVRPVDEVTGEQATVGHAFVELETWFWKYGWDLRSDYVQENLDGLDDDDDEYQPVIVDLDETGKEIGLVSWN